MWWWTEKRSPVCHLLLQTVKMFFSSAHMTSGVNLVDSDYRKYSPSLEVFPRFLYFDMNLQQNILSFQIENWFLQSNINVKWKLNQCVVDLAAVSFSLWLNLRTSTFTSHMMMMPPPCFTVASAKQKALILVYSTKEPLSSWLHGALILFQAFILLLIIWKFNSLNAQKHLKGKLPGGWGQRLAAVHSGVTQVQ